MNGTRHHLWVSQGTVWQFVWQAVKGLFTIKDFLIRRQRMQDRIHKNVLLNLASGAFKDNWCVLSDVCSSQTKNALSYGLSGDGRVTWYTWSKCRCNNIKWKIHGSEELREPQTQKKEKWINYNREQRNELKVCVNAMVILTYTVRKQSSLRLISVLVSYEATQ